MLGDGMTGCTMDRAVGLVPQMLQRVEVSPNMSPEFHLPDLTPPGLHPRSLAPGAGALFR